MIGKYFFEKNNLGNVSVGIVPISILLLIPNQFFFTSPYSFSLIWAVISIAALFTYLRNNDYSDYVFSMVAILTSFLIHPFVSLSVLPWIILALVIIKFSKKNKILFFILLIIISSMISFFCFGVYNWLKGSTIEINNPALYIKNFFDLFRDPHWYIKSGSSFQIWFLYFYEKISFIFIILILTLGSFIEKKKITSNIFYFFIVVNIFL